MQDGHLVGRVDDDKDLQKQTADGAHLGRDLCLAFVDLNAVTLAKLVEVLKLVADVALVPPPLVTSSVNHAALILKSNYSLIY